MRMPHGWLAVRWWPAMLLACLAVTSLGTAEAAKIGGPEDAAVVQAARELQAWLATSPNGPGWLEYLDSDKLFADLKTNGLVDSVNRRSIIALHDRLSQPIAGLEKPRFVALRKALEPFVTATAKGSQQLPARPNFLAQVSGRLLERRIERLVEEDRPLHDNILGTKVHGTGHTTGTVKVRLVPSEDQGMIALDFRGAVASKTIGANGPVRIYTDGKTNFVGSKIVTFDSDGLEAGRSNFDARTRGHTTGISTTAPKIVKRLVCRIAWKKVGEKRAEADCIAGQRAERQIARSFDEQVIEGLTRVNHRYREQLRPRLLEVDAFPRDMHFRTTEENLYLSLVEASAGQASALEEAPTLASEADAAIRMHESAVNNFSTSLLAGRRMTQEEAAKEAIALLGRVPEGLEPGEDKKSWSITFAEELPVELRIDGNEANVTIRATAFSSGDKAYGGMNISAKYRTTWDKSGVRAERVGDLTIFPPGFDPNGTARLSLRDVSLKRILQRRFEKILKPSMNLDSPLVWSANGGREVALDVSNFSADNGWLALELMMNSE